MPPSACAAHATRIAAAHKLRTQTEGAEMTVASDEPDLHPPDAGSSRSRVVRRTAFGGPSPDPEGDAA